MMATLDKEKAREHQRRWREKHRAAKNEAARQAYAQMDHVAKRALLEIKRERERNRARKGGHGRRYPAPRSLREWVVHLQRWSNVELKRALLGESQRDAMAAHEAWLESLDRPGGDSEDAV